MELFGLAEMADVYVDAYVTDDDNQLLFLSCWGHDTALQELMAKLSLPSKEGGLTSLSLLQGKNPYARVYRKQWDNLTKITGRVGKDCLFSALSHVWIMDRTAKQLDKASQRALLLKQPKHDPSTFNAYLWQVVRELCAVPLLAEWDELLTHFSQHDWIRHYSGVNMNAVEINLGNDAVKEVITQLIQQRVLTLPKRHPLSLVTARTSF